MSVDTLVLRLTTSGFDSARREMISVSTNLSTLEGQAQRMERLGGGFTTAGAIISGAAVALGAFNRKNIEAANYADDTARKLKGMLEVRGEGAMFSQLMALSAEMQKATGQSDELFSNASAHLLSFGLTARQITELMPGLVGNARTMDQSLDSAADSFGKAFASGNVGALTRSGVVLSEADKKTIAVAKSTSEAAGQQAIYNAVLRSYSQYALKAGEGISKTARAQNYFNQLLGDAQEQMGQGAAEARMGMYEKAAVLLEKFNASPGTLKQVGAWSAY
jgi:hypothetical protein